MTTFQMMRDLTTRALGQKPPISVLIVDSNRFLVDSFQQIMNFAGFNVEIVSSGEEAMVGAKDINVILDERARELCGEQQRWFDLKRTGKLLDRVKLYNGTAKANIQSFHVLRPIPQPQMDAITNKTGGPDPNGFWQNTGY